MGDRLRFCFDTQHAFAAGYDLRTAEGYARTFAEFSDFLHVLEQGRSAENQVTDLPVYLVLSKCDLLAKKTDSAAVWIQRIEERKRQVHQRFQQFMEGAAGSTRRCFAMLLDWAASAPSRFWSFSIASAILAASGTGMY